MCTSIRRLDPKLWTLVCVPLPRSRDVIDGSFSFHYGRSHRHGKTLGGLDPPNLKHYKAVEFVNF